MVLATALAVSAAFLFASSAALQQHAARKVAPDQPSQVSTRRLWDLMNGLVRHRSWMLGWITNLCGFLTQAIALHVGSVALVQPVLVAQLLFALPLASAQAGRWPTRRDWLSGVCISGGLALILSVDEAVPDEGHPDRSRVVLAALCAIGLAALLILLANRCQPLLHSVFVGAAAGLCFALSAVFIKMTTESLDSEGIAATATDWPGYALALSTLTGLVLGQQALASGSLPAAVAAMTITNPTASYLLGVFAFHVSIPTDPGVLATVSSAGLLLYVGVVGLAHSGLVLQGRDPLPVTPTGGQSEDPVGDPDRTVSSSHEKE